MSFNFDDSERAKIIAISTCRGMKVLKVNRRDFSFATVENCVEFLASLIWSHLELAEQVEMNPKLIASTLKPLQALDALELIGYSFTFVKSEEFGIAISAALYFEPSTLDNNETIMQNDALASVRKVFCILTLIRGKERVLQQRLLDGIGGKQCCCVPTLSEVLANQKLEIKTVQSCCWKEDICSARCHFHLR